MDGHIIPSDKVISARINYLKCEHFANSENLKELQVDRKSLINKLEQLNFMEESIVFNLAQIDKERSDLVQRLNLLSLQASPAEYSSSS